MAWVSSTSKRAFGTWTIYANVGGEYPYEVVAMDIRTKRRAKSLLKRLRAANPQTEFYAVEAVDVTNELSK